MTKPFNPLELVARVKSQLRRYTRLGAAIPVENAHIYETGGLSINDDLKEVLSLIHIYPMLWQRGWHSVKLIILHC